uniref:NADH dehydrogenase subunit 3 n=1 Tax=Tassonia gloriae TaxID=3064207 RepID=UPI00286B9EA5|nr:NADH dehydrogenase subunit 3 [Tassonia gloriae]WKV28886.1 NADH dehydrogenase subunit 3 [Tassonia gloriae]
MMNLFALLVLLILFGLILLNFVLSKKSFKDREKSSSFECGFDSILNSRLPFSLHFYLVSIIFLIFDIEIAVVLPLVYFLDFIYDEYIWTMFIIFFILLLGLYSEWVEGALVWFK